MRALIDETVPLVGGHHAYVVVATLLIETDQALVEASALSIIGERRKSFHWIDEGANVRQRAITCLIDLGACAHVVVHHPTGRKKQQQAREAALRVAIPMALEDGATELMIESRGADLDVKDRVAVMGSLSALKRDDVHYSWHDKSRPEMWLADAACGAMATYLTGAEPWWHKQLVEGGVFASPTYIKDA